MAKFTPNREEIMASTNRYREMQVALLDCFEFFRDELQAHTCELMAPKLGARMNERFSQLLDKCDRALGEPSVADVQRIREAAKGGTT